MGRYIDGSSRENKGSSSIKISQEVDVNAIAQAVANALGGFRRGYGGEELADDFDDSKSMENLAEAMIVQRSKNESNFEDLGTVKETKKDKGSVDKTIDILSNMGD